MNDQILYLVILLVKASVLLNPGEMKVSFIPLPGVDEAIFAPSTDGLFCARKGKRWGYVDCRGKVAVPFRYAEASVNFREGLGAVDRTGAGSSWGFCDRDGKLVIPHRYIKAEPFYEGRACVTRVVKDQWRYGYVDVLGNEIIACRYAAASAFSGGLAGVVDEAYVSSFIRSDGSPAFAFRSTANIGLAAFAFVEGFAAICTNDHKYGFLDARGEPACELKYDKAWAFSEGLGAVAVRVGLTDDDHENSLYQVGYVDARGREVIKPRFGGAYAFKEGFARVDLDHPVVYGKRRVGFINRDGDEAVPCEYDDAGDFSEGVAAVQRGENWGYVNARGDVVIDFRYSSAGAFSGGVAAVGIFDGNPGSYGYIDKEGNEILPREYSFAWRAVGGVALVELGGEMSSSFETSPGARYLVIFGSDAPADPKAVHAMLRDAWARVRAADNDADVDAAWPAFSGALARCASDDQRRAALEKFADEAEHPKLCEYLAAKVSQLHADALLVRVLSRAVKRRPDNEALLLGLQTAHLRVGNDKKAAKIGALLLKAPPPSIDRSEVQEKIDEMHRIVNAAYADFVAGRSVTAASLREARRAAELERELLAYWQSCSLTGRDIEKNRGELSASGLFIAALRHKKKFDEAADWFRNITRDRHLLAQCLRDFQAAAENTLNNGLGALIDTNKKSDLDYGGEVLAFLDETLKKFATPLLPLACACVATKLGQIDRALGYLEIAIRVGKGKKIVSDNGTDICAMARGEPDLAPLRERKEFAKIVGRNATTKKSRKKK